MARRAGRNQGRGSLKHQIKQKLRSLDRIGQSKHAAKQEEKARCEASGERWNPAKVDGIYSYKTMESYKEHSYKFVEWVRCEHPEVRNFEDIKREYVGEWLKESIDKGNSAWTTRLEAAAMAKVLDCSSRDFGVELPKRERADITRSREEKFHDKEISLDRHRDLVDFCKGSGLRRHEIAEVRPSQITQEREKVFIKDVTGKGGKERTLEVVKQYREHVLECRNRAIADGRERIFEKVPNRLDVHSYRREYCQERYKEIAERLDRERGNRELAKQEKYYTRDGTHRVFDKEALREVSREMGHDRTDVMVAHYLNLK